MTCLHQLKCNVRLYADDAMLYSTIHTLADCISLQQDFEHTLPLGYYMEHVFQS